MARPQQAVKQWLKDVAPEVARIAAIKAGTSVPHLRHVAAGRRNLSADLAQRLAHATGMDQRDLCEACGRCELAK